MVINVMIYEQTSDGSKLLETGAEVLPMYMSYLVVAGETHTHIIINIIMLK